MNAKLRRLRFIVPGNIAYRSGGNAYNWSVVDQLRESGADVELRAVEGEWPEATEAGLRALAGELSSTPADAVVLIDALTAIAAPDLIEKAVQANGSPNELWVLAHMGFPEQAVAEDRLLRAATGVICPSQTLALELQGRHADIDVHVVHPGTEPAALSTGSEPPHLICVAALLPNKCQLLVVDALSRLSAEAWTASFVGTDQPDPEYAGQVRAAIRQAGLEGRVELTGERHGDDLEAEWLRANLSVLVSVRESYGIVVAESLAHGVPAIVRAGTGASEALGLGGAGQALTLSPGTEAEELGKVLATWLRDESLRSEWRDAAVRARDNRRTWEAAAADIAALLWHDQRRLRHD